MAQISRLRNLPRQRKPELELAYSRSPALGYESQDAVGAVKCLSHGFPTPLARWHYHDEFELHLIVATSGKAFVGDYIGSFQPGHLVLTGPKLPHNWISLDVPDQGVELRDLVIQFDHQPIVQAAAIIPELTEVLPLFERARYGIEFMGLSERATEHWHAVRSQQGLARFAAFCDFLADLSRCSDYRLLSHSPLQSIDDHAQLDRVDVIVKRIAENLAVQFSVAELAREFAMTESQFSRSFRRATGNSFTDFVNRVRINQACRLLMQSDRYITHICYDVGFNNIANFNRRFMDIKGMTPSEFRRSADRRYG